MVRHDAPSFPGKALLGELQRVLTAGECDVIILSQLRDAAGLRKLCFAAVHHQVRVIIPEGYVDSAESLPIHLYLFSFDTAIEYERRRNRFLREARAMKSKDHAQQKR